MAPDRFTAPELWIDGRPASQGPAKARYSTRPDRKPQQCPRQRSAGELGTEKRGTNLELTKGR